MKSYKINEIFYSIQGEGRNVGMPCVFVRFSGCNLACNYCDTRHIPHKKMVAEAILEILTFHECPNVVFTGGEPMLQLDLILLLLLKQYHFKLFLETNGTIDKPAVLEMMDWVTISPKNLDSWKLRKGNELKLVLTPEIEIRQFMNFDFKYHYLQPCYGFDNKPKNLDEVISNINLLPQWNLSLQLQKHFGWR
jgi:7-carboxy-7-deazaguanine synthase